VARDAREKARSDIRRAQARFEQTGDKHEEARKVRRESFERGREAGLTLREMGEAAELHWTRIARILGKK
jgi:hypothetical protein